MWSMDSSTWIMKANYAILVLSLLPLILICCSFGKPIELKCDSLAEIENLAIEMFNADEVIIESIWLKEEIFFEGLDCFFITIINGTTPALNFKELADDQYHRFENYQEIEHQLKENGLPIVEKIREECDLSNFDQIMVVFAKRKDDGTLFYSIANSY